MHLPTLSPPAFLRFEAERFAGFQEQIQYLFQL